MPEPPSPPPGFQSRYQIDSTARPGTTWFMLAVFLTCSWLVLRFTRPIQLTERSLLLSIVGITIVVEGIHETLHSAAFRLRGLESTIFWTKLAVIPEEQFVTKRDLIIAALTPLVVVSMIVGLTLMISRSNTVILLMGYVFAVNISISVLDLVSAALIIPLQSGAVIWYEVADEVDIWVFEPRT